MYFGQNLFAITSKWVLLIFIVMFVLLFVNANGEEANSPADKPIRLVGFEIGGTLDQNIIEDWRKASSELMECSAFYGCRSPAYAAVIADKITWRYEYKYDPRYAKLFIGRPEVITLSSYTVAEIERLARLGSVESFAGRRDLKSSKVWNEFVEGWKYVSKINVLSCRKKDNKDPCEAFGLVGNARATTTEYEIITFENGLIAGIGVNYKLPQGTAPSIAALVDLYKQRYERIEIAEQSEKSALLLSERDELKITRSRDSVIDIFLSVRNNVETPTVFWDAFLDSYNPQYSNWSPELEQSALDELEEKKSKAIDGF